MIKKDFKEIKNAIIEYKSALKAIKSRINTIELVISLKPRICRKNAEWGKTKDADIAGKDKEQREKCPMWGFFRSTNDNRSNCKATFEETYITSIFNEFTDQKGLLTTWVIHGCHFCFECIYRSVLLLITWV